jgi:hypothetical protein
LGVGPESRWAASPKSSSYSLKRDNHGICKLFSEGEPNKSLANKRKWKTSSSYDQKPVGVKQQVANNQSHYSGRPMEKNQNAFEINIVALSGNRKREYYIM